MLLPGAASLEEQDQGRTALAADGNTPCLGLTQFPLLMLPCWCHGMHSCVPLAGECVSDHWLYREVLPEAIEYF